MKLKQFVKFKVPYPKATIAILGIVVAFSIVGLIISSITNYKINKYTAEEAVAMQYRTQVRDKLFNLIIEENRLELIDLLNTELSRTMRAIETRLHIRAEDMSKQHKKLYSTNKANLGTLFSSSLRSFSSDFLQSLEGRESLTSEELKVFKELRDIWQRNDEYINENKLTRVYIRESSYSTTRYGNRHSGPWRTSIEFITPDGDLVATHATQLLKDYIQLSRTLYDFVSYDVSSVNISEDKLLGDDLNEDSFQDFLELMRDFSFKRIDSTIDFEPIYYLVFYNKSTGKSPRFNIEIGEKYIRVSKTSHLPVYSKHYEEKYWNELLSNIELDGVYTSSSQLVKAIKELLSKVS